MKLPIHIGQFLQPTRNPFSVEEIKNETINIMKSEGMKTDIKNDDFERRRLVSSEYGRHSNMYQTLFCFTY